MLQAVTAYSSGERGYASYLSEQVFYLNQLICSLRVVFAFCWCVCILYTCFEGGLSAWLLLIHILSKKLTYSAFLPSHSMLPYPLSNGFEQCFAALPSISFGFSCCMLYSSLDASLHMYLRVYSTPLVSVSPYIRLNFLLHSNAYDISMDGCRGSCKTRRLKRQM